MIEAAGGGLLCEAGGFWIDPWEPVERAVVTHAHPDHARPGSQVYLAARSGVPLLRSLLGADARIETLEYGETIRLGGVAISFHPAGHIPGSAQVRVEQAGEVWVISGDYRPGPADTCLPFEPVPCHNFVTEATFALPVYRWPPEEEVLQEIRAWWNSSRESGKTAVLFAHPLGKAQRLLAGLARTGTPVAAHEAVEAGNALFRQAGVALPDTTPARDARRGALILAPLQSRSEAWFRRLGPVSTALASGWMRIRGTRRRRSLDRGFIFADHPDWGQLLKAIHDTGAAQVRVTHGYSLALVRWLLEQGLDAGAIPAPYEPDPDETGGQAEPASGREER